MCMRSTLNHIFNVRRDFYGKENEMGPDPLHRGGDDPGVPAGLSHHGVPVWLRHRALPGDGGLLPAGSRDHRGLGERRGVDRVVQRRWSRVQGVLFLANAAICPAGWLLAQYVAFDTDFILLAQYVGFVIASAAGAVPLALPLDKE